MRQNPALSVTVQVSSGLHAASSQLSGVHPWTLPVQVPAPSQVSLAVQVRPSLHAVPKATAVQRLVLEAVSRTNRCVIVHEDFLTGGFGAEISARIMEEVFDQLDAPVARVAAKDVYCPYARSLETQVLPQAEWIVTALKQTLEY